MRNKRLLYILLMFILVSCFHGTDVERETTIIQNDFWLTRSITDNNYALLWSTDSLAIGGVTVISESIQEIESNEDFIIANQLPQYAKGDGIQLNYYIIDLTKYQSPHRETYKVYEFSTKEDFNAKKNELGINIDIN